MLPAFRATKKREIKPIEEVGREGGGQRNTLDWSRHSEAREGEQNKHWRREEEKKNSSLHLQRIRIRRSFQLLFLFFWGFFISPTSYWVISPLGSTGSSHLRKIMSSSGVKVRDSGAMPPGTAEQKTHEL